MSDARSTGSDGRPLRHLVVYANPSTESFDHAIVKTYVEAARSYGQEVDVRDLYALEFDPVLRTSEKPRDRDWVPEPDVARELDLLRAASILTFVYPIWFGMPPAMIKGYVDRVLGANYSFSDFRDQAGQPGLAGKPLLTFSTSGLSAAWLRQHEQSQSIRQVFDIYLWRGFGMKQSELVHLDNIVPGMDPAVASARLAEVRRTAERTCASLAGLEYGSPPSEA